MTIETNDPSLLRMIGVMAIGVAAAWALQILAFGEAGSAFSRLTWVVMAASIAGAGAGLVFVSSIPPREKSAAA